MTSRSPGPIPKSRAPTGSSSTRRPAAVDDPVVERERSPLEELGTSRACSSSRGAHGIPARRSAQADRQYAWLAQGEATSRSTTGSSTAAGAASRTGYRGALATSESARRTRRHIRTPASSAYPGGQSGDRIAASVRLLLVRLESRATLGEHFATVARRDSCGNWVASPSRKARRRSPSRRSNALRVRTACERAVSRLANALPRGDEPPERRSSSCTAALKSSGGMPAEDSARLERERDARETRRRRSRRRDRASAPEREDHEGDRDPTGACVSPSNPLRCDRERKHAPPTR